MSGRPETPILVKPSDAALRRAAELLHAGRLVAFPTETVYGLGADATNDHAVARIFAAKKRPRFNPLIVHVRARAGAERLAAFDSRADVLAEAFCPGPLTLVLRRADGCAVSMLACAGLETVALRVPAEPVAHDLLEAFGGPIAAPSANPSGTVSPTTAEHVAAGLDSDVDLILDGGPCRLGIESTIVGLAGPQALLLRPGGMPRAALEALIGPLSAPAPGASPQAPGGSRRHYAPGLPLRLNVTSLKGGEALLGFGPKILQGAAAVLNLSERGDLVEAAANLFAHMRALDRPGFSAIAVMPIPEEGLGEAINDRLRRAAAPI
jgi:L-threonylcarbamoyladenylate synthase